MVIAITIPAPWQRVEVAGENALTVTVGVTVNATLTEVTLGHVYPEGPVITTS